MIKIFFKFIGGLIIGAILAFCVAYVFGYVMEVMQIRLYETEAEQQRNFNIFSIFTLLIAISGGYLATKIGNKN